MIEEEFKKIFGRDATASASAPGRVNLIGEHTDYNGGAALPTALNRHVDVALAKSASDFHHIYSSIHAATASRRPGEPANDGWSDYAVGALYAAEQLGLINGAVELAIASDIPPGAGVSSSAALVTAILRACANMCSINLDPLKIAETARAVENTYIGVPCGIMDQMAVGLCVPGQALALNALDFSYDVIDIPDAFEFVTLHSGISRELSDGRYEQRFEECRQASSLLKIDNLCLAPLSNISKLGDTSPTLQRRARHVISEQGRTLAATQALRDGDHLGFGQLMNESHKSYSRDFEASTPEIDKIVETASELGAIGSRLTGGGFGGCVVSLVQKGTGEAWIERMIERHPNAWAP